MATNTCGCCKGTEKLTPLDTANRPGLPALVYRVGTHATFLETMKARLSTMVVEIPPEQDARQASGESEPYPLQGLTSREADDPAIALLDGWATVADVLTFYQERIANEGYLRTATERRSVLELARLLGYSLRPGVAATAYLAYTIEPTQTTPVVIPIGARAQSVPGPGELPQSFETIEKLEARAAWNTLKPRLSRPQHITAQNGTISTDTIYLKGTTTLLKPNDPLLVDVGNGGPPVLCFVESVELQPDMTDPDKSRTMVMLQASATGRALPGGRGIVAAELDDAAASKRTALAYVNAVRSVIDKYLDLESFNVDPTSKMTGRVVTALSDLAGTLSDAVTPRQLTGLLRATYLPRLHRERTAAGKGGFTRLEPWIGGIIAEMEEAIATATDELGGNSARDFALAGASLRSTSQQAMVSSSLTGVLTQLDLAPSVPPRSTWYLPRTPKAVFGANADMGLQVIDTVRPELQATVAAAVTNQQATPSSTLEVHAFRIKAAVHGHNAPKRAVTDASGVVIGRQEWPLDGTRTIGITLTEEQRPDLPVIEHANVLLRDQSGAFSASAKLDREASTTITVGPAANRWTISFGKAGTVPTSNGLAVKVTDSENSVVQTLNLRRIPTDGSIVLTVKTYNKDDVSEQSLRPDQSLSLQLDTRLITMANTILWPEGDLSPTLYVMSVTTELLLPPRVKDVVALDAPYEQIVQGSRVAILRNGSTLITSASSVRQAAKVDYDFPAKVTELSLGTWGGTSWTPVDWLTDGDLLLSDVRDTVIYAQSERLELAEEPITTEICGTDAWIELNGLYRGLQSGRWLIISGERTDVVDDYGGVVPGIRASELVMLARTKQDVQQLQSSATQTYGYGYDYYGEPRKDLPGDKTHTFVQLAEPLHYCYKRDTVTIYGNVVKATHGETRNETLGNGDGSKALQSFALKQPPLTYVPAATPAGAESTLKVYVNDVEWHETDALAGLAPTDRRFITRTDDDGKTSVIFGDGRAGARVPTGIENVKAVYRNGIGKGGNVQAEQISLLATRPLGVKGVINPMRASGGADKETRDQARRNAPLTVLALDRLVSVQDYADFARSFAGIGKSAATRISVQRRELVHLTIAGADDIPIDDSSDLYRNLVKALRQFGDPDQPVQVDLRELKMLVISAKIRILPDYLWDKVVESVRFKLLDTFSFDRRELGQDVLLSEVICAIQAVAGVAYVDVDLLAGIDEKRLDDSTKARRLQTPVEIAAQVQEAIGNSGHPEPRLPVNLADASGGVIRPAQLAFLSPAVQDTLILNQIQ